MKRLFPVGLFLSLAIHWTGCGAGSELPYYVITGQASFETVPIESGDILFWPKHNDLPAVGGRIANGKFSVSAPAGDYIVKITASRPVPGKTTTGATGETIPLMEGFIPAQFNSKSELETTVVPGTNPPLDYQLKSSDSATRR